MLETSRTAYLFQCEGEDLYAVSHDITGANIPRSPCTLGWRLCRDLRARPAADGARTGNAGAHSQGYRRRRLLCLARLERRPVEAPGTVALRRPR